MAILEYQPLSRVDQKLVSPDVKSHFTRITAKRINSGFHKVLGLSTGEYQESFQAAIESSERFEGMSGVPVLVEPRVSIKTQCDLLGVDISPSVFRFPEPKDRDPYVAFLNILSNPGVPARVFLDSIPSTHESENGMTMLASPQEALAADLDFLLAHRFVYLQGDATFFFGQRLLGLDMYKGKPRIMAPEGREFDEFIGALVATRSNGGTE